MRYTANPALLAACGVGPEVAAALLVTAGDNPDRMRNDASFAALCGASPIEASSGRTARHRLNRGGNRQANNALWRIAMTRLRVDERTIAYAQRRSSPRQDPTRDPALPQTPHRTRDLPPAHRPAPDPPRNGPTPTTNPTRPHPQRHSPSTQHPHRRRISELERGLRHNRDLAERYQQHLGPNHRLRQT